jgi:hypothetical protein
MSAKAITLAAATVAALEQDLLAIRRHLDDALSDPPLDHAPEAALELLACVRTIEWTLGIADTARAESLRNEAVEAMNGGAS